MARKRPSPHALTLDEHQRAEEYCTKLREIVTLRDGLVPLGWAEVEDLDSVLLRAASSRAFAPIDRFLSELKHKAGRHPRNLARASAMVLKSMLRADEFSEFLLVYIANECDAADLNQVRDTIRDARTEDVRLLEGPQRAADDAVARLAGVSRRTVERARARVGPVPPVPDHLSLLRLLAGPHFAALKAAVHHQPELALRMLVESESSAQAFRDRIAELQHESEYSPDDTGHAHEAVSRETEDEERRQVAEVDQKTEETLARLRAVRADLEGSTPVVEKSLDSLRALAQMLLSRHL